MRNYMKVLAIGLMLALFGVASGNAQTYTQIAPTNPGYVNVSGVPGTFASKRDSTSGTGTAETTAQIGMLIVSSNFAIYRSFATFQIPELASADACTLYFYGSADNSDTDFEVYIHTASNYGTIDVLDYIKFDGRTVGSAHTGSILNATWNSSSYSANWNKIIFNAAGLDTLKVYSGKPLYLAMISKEDYINSQPAGNERVTFLYVSSVPYLALSYTPGGWSGTIGNLTNPAAVGAYSKTEIKEIR